MPHESTIIGLGRGRLGRGISGIEVIQQSESLPFEFDRGGLSITGWECTITVKQYPADTAIIERQIDPVGNGWPGFLTSSETSLLGEGLWYLTGTLVNIDDDMLEQIPLRFQVAVPWA